MPDFGLEWEQKICTAIKIMMSKNIFMVAFELIYWLVACFGFPEVSKNNAVDKQVK